MAETLRRTAGKRTNASQLAAISANVRPVPEPRERREEIFAGGEGSGLEPAQMIHRVND
jgi:hypothetical protein